MLTGNKGEWSEIYVFLKLLADGELKAADENLEVMPNICYPIIKILRQENENLREYQVNSVIKIVDGKTNKEIANIPVRTFLDYSQRLFDSLILAKSSSFAFEDIEKFLNTIDVHSLTNSKNKRDITIVVHDPKMQISTQLGFSIKSMLGKASTLLNPGKTTNAIYEIVGKGDIDIEKFNVATKEAPIHKKIAALREKGFELKFQKMSGHMFQLNLKLIDSDLPKIVSELLLIKFSTEGKISILKSIEKLKSDNPLNFDLLKEHPFYEYKIKNLLTDVALGMTPAKKWTGKYNATGGIIIVKKDGETVCYHIYNRNEFQNYLINNTHLEQASKDRYDYGDLYNENGKTFINLNLQIRFNN